MFKFKIGLSAVAMAVAALLVGCGGGSSEPVLPPLVATGSITAPIASCIVQQDVGTCSVTANVTTANATTVILKDSKGISYAVTMNTTVAVPVNVPVGGETYTLSFGGASNPSVTISAKCLLGTSADASGVCKAPVKLTYDNVHVAVRFHNLGLIDGAGLFVEAKNNSKRAVGKFKRIDGVYIAEEPLAGSCLYPALSRMTDDSKYYVVAYNPVTNSFVDYDGTLPAGYEFTNDTNGGLSVVGAKWHRVQRFDPAGKADWGTPPFDYMATWTTDGTGGWYYTRTQNPGLGNLFHLRTNGSNIVTYPLQADGGEFMVMNTISCH